MRRLALVLAAPLALTTACSGASGPGQSVTTAPVGTAHWADWPTYHGDNSRSGHAAPITGALRRAWSTRLDGAVYGEPLVVGRTLIAATENDSVYGLNAASGKTLWHTHLGQPQAQSQLPCGDIDPLGITGTPAYDTTTGSVFVVAETTGGHHTLWALDAANGHRRWHRSTDVLSDRDRSAQQQRSALLVADGRIITTYGGLDGDCGNYVGYVTSTSTSGRGRTTHYAVPTAREAGMWSPPGPVAGPNGNIYVASGNGAQVSGTWDKSDSVTELRPVSLRRVAAFAPVSWRQDNAGDLDLGSSSPLPVNDRLVIAGKRGVVYLLKPSLGGIGGEIATASGCAAFGGAAHAGSLVVLPCVTGIRALTVTSRSLRLKWTASGIYGSPVIAGNRVYVADRDSGALKVLSLATGRVLKSLPAGSLTHFPSEVVDGSYVYVPTLSGVTAFRGS